MPDSARPVKPVFTCSFQGGSDYQWKGQSYEVRSSCADYRHSQDNHASQAWHAQKLALVGTILNHSASCHEFPPRELEAFFPGYVRARFDSAWQVVYASARPEVIHSDVLESTLALVWAQELRGHGVTLHKEPA